VPTWLSSEKPCVIADVDYPQGIAGTNTLPPCSIAARRTTGETVACESNEDSHARARPRMDMTTFPVTNALQPLQRDVQRLLGRCLLRLQQYERLMKAIVAHHEISGPAHSLEAIRAARIEDAATKTLGTLIGQLFGSYVVTDGNGGEERDDDLPGDVISIRRGAWQRSSSSRMCSTTWWSMASRRTARWTGRPPASFVRYARPPRSWPSRAGHRSPPLAAGSRTGIPSSFQPSTAAAVGGRWCTSAAYSSFATVRWRGNGPPGTDLARHSPATRSHLRASRERLRRAIPRG